MNHAEQRVLEIFQHHFARVWAARHDAHGRMSVRQNIKGQRDCRKTIAATA